MFNAIREYALFEQAGARPDLADAALARSMADRFTADWERYSMDGVYADPEAMLRESQRLHVRQRLLGFDLIRSNPNICGYNLTGMLDHALTGEGLWSFWREWKPGIVDALADGWAALRWCLFCDPLHSYVDQPLALEAVLANEDVLGPGSYGVRVGMRGPNGTAWERTTQLSVPALGRGQDAPLAITTLREEVKCDGPAGSYELAATMLGGGYPAGGRLRLYRSARSSRLDEPLAVTAWAVGETLERWLTAHGVACRPFTIESSPQPDLLVIGDRASQTQQLEAWRSLMRRVWNGAAAVFLSPSVFVRDQDTTAWLPLATKGRCYAFNDWLYHKETVAKAHPMWDGLPGQGILDIDFYGPVIPQYLFDGQDIPDEVAAAAFAVGYSCPGGYASGLVLGVYRFGAGYFIVNTLRVLEQLDQHPAADRLLLNMLAYAGRRTVNATASEASGLDAHFARIGFS